MPRQSLRVLARVYYAGTGLVVGVFAVSLIWSALSSASRGCQLVFSRSGMWEPPRDGPIPTTMPDCQQYVDLVPIGLGLLAALLLLVTAIAFGRRDGWSHVIVGLGALVGIAASAIPLALIWWVSDYYDESAPDAMGILLGALPILVGLGAAWVTWRAHRRRSAILPAAAG